MDPITMARFFAMPGAFRALTALASIPDGPLREASVVQLEAIALTYAGAPVSMHGPDPLLMAAQGAREAAPALPAPKMARPAASDEERIMALRLQGRSPREIVEETDLPLMQVQAVIRAARASGPIPPVNKPKDKKGAKAAPPAKRFVTRMEQIDGRAMRGMELAAKRRRKTVPEYMRARAEFIRLRSNKKPMDEIADAIGIDEPTCWNWLSQAIAAGYDLVRDVEYEDAEIEDKAPPAAPEEPQQFLKGANGATVLMAGQKVFPGFNDVGAKVRGAIMRGATARGMTTNAYEAMRENVVRLRLEGMSPTIIAERTGETEVAVKDLITGARQRGVIFPKIAPHVRTKAG